MDLGADRMANTVFNDQDVKTELEVVKEERRSAHRQQPVCAACASNSTPPPYTAHTYGRPIIGWMSEVERTDRGGRRGLLCEHYYTPANAALVVAGDVEPEKVLELARKYYGVLKNTADVPVRAAHP